MSGRYDDASQGKPSNDSNEKRSKSSKRRGDDESETVEVSRANAASEARSRPADNGRPPKPAESLPSSRPRVDNDDNDEYRGMNKNASTAQFLKWTEAQQNNKDKQQQQQQGGKDRVIKETVSIGKAAPVASNTNTKPYAASSSVSVKKKLGDDDDDDYGDEGFEDYDEDFEDESSPQKQKKTPAPAPAAKKSAVAAAAASSSTSNNNNRGPSPQPQNSSARGAGGLTLEPEINVDELRQSMQQENQEALLRRRQDDAAGADGKSGGAGAGGIDTKRSKKSAPEAATGRQQQPPLKDQEVAASKTSTSTSATAAARTRTKRFSSASMSVSTAMTLDPRGRRLAKLLASGVLDMQEEKVTQLNIIPSNPYDQYQRQLRSQPTSIRQQAAPADQETRDVEVATDDILMKDKEVQFSYGDDTKLLNIIKAVVDRREARRQGKPPTTTLMEVINRDIDKISSTTAASTSSTGNDGDDENAGGESSSSPRNDSSSSSANRDASGSSNVAAAGGARLGFFLQRASLLCETLIDEVRHNRSDTQPVDNRKNRSMFSDSAWQSFGSAHFVDEKARLVMKRRTVSIRFSPLQPHLLVTAHPFPDNPDAAGDDIHPLKGLYSIWDVFTPGAPIHILSASGQPTCCCFSGSQTFLVLAGTAEGSLHLWDLRENSLLHKDRGVRAPCYSTHFSSGASQSSGEGGGSGSGWSHSQGSRGSSNNRDILAEEQHNAPITQVEALGDSDWGVAAVVSQFATLDRSGTIILWITSNLAAPGTAATGTMTSSASGRDGGVSGNTNSGFDASSGSGITAGGSGDLGLSPWGRVALVQTKVLRSFVTSLSAQLSSLSMSTTTNNNSSSKQAERGGRDRDRDDSESSLLSSSISSGSLKASRAVLCSIPGDASTMLLAGPKGRVCKVARFGDAAAPQQLSPEVARVEMFQQGGGGREEVPFFAPVTCIIVRAATKSQSKTTSSSSSSAAAATAVAKQDKERKERERQQQRDEGKDSSEEGKDRDDADHGNNNKDTSSPSSSPPPAAQLTLVLVGRSDGTVDLYHMDSDSPVQTWSISDFADRASSNNKGKDGSRSRPEGVSSIVMVRWCPTRASAFLVVDAAGNCHYFDLLQDVYVPVFSDLLDTDCVSPLTVDLSRCRPGSNTAYLAAATATAGNTSSGGGSSGISISVRKLWEGVVQCVSGEEEKLTAALPGWSGRTCLPQVTAYLPQRDDHHDDGDTGNRGK